MNKEINKEMEALIRSWSLPKPLKGQEGNVDFKFDDNGLVNTHEEGYHCQDGNVKFCLYDQRNGSVLFSMDFYKSNPVLARYMNRKEKSIKLELLYVHDESLRRLGIASYYIARLKGYAIHEEMECIYVQANANAGNSKGDSKVNALSQKELEEFYLRKSTEEMPIELES